MNNAILAAATRKALAQVRYVSPVPPARADGLVADVYAQVKRDFGMVAPPIALHSPAPTALAAAWMLLRETLLVPGRVTRAEKEVVAAAVSAANACPYCVTVHTAAVRGLTGGSEPARITLGQIANPGLNEIARWAGSVGRSGPGLPTGLVTAGAFTELAGVAVTFHYLNRMVDVFLPDSPLPMRLPAPAGGILIRALSSVMLSPNPVPGAALDLLPKAPLPAELGWTSGEPRIAAALGRAAAAFDEAGAEVVPGRVRELLHDTLARWNGNAPGPSQAWADAAVAGLAVPDRAAGRLAILTAMAPYQVRPEDIGAFLASVSEARRADYALVRLTSWASMAAARVVGSWLGQTSRNSRPRTDLDGIDAPRVL